ncbi:unnamed protein product [Coffea canephora]|uniref:RRM domain-containing protein n=1 Tax=Coffea canephora TaxID=49390 RepID=A0A068UBH6_COFCA|nr:unnamed protein product [Coffea canephora]
MALRAAAKTAATAATAASPRGLRSLLFSTSTFPFNLPQSQTEKPPPAEPSTNLFFMICLSKRTTTEGLRTAFEKFGQVVDAKVVTDRASGFSKGFGFVRYASLEDAAAGIEGMDGKFLDGWVIFAEYARPRNTLPPPQNSFPHGVNNTRFQS